MKAKLFYLLLLLPGAFYPIAAQNNLVPSPCGTAGGKPEWLQHYQSHRGDYPESADTLYVPLTIHLVGTDNGSGYFNPLLLRMAMCTLNKDFAPSSIQFFIEGEINYIANTKYYEHDWDGGAEMMDLYKVNNTINCYVVESPVGNCGYSWWGRGIALAKSCMSSNDHTWAHEIGHFLSLPHTFNGWEGITYDYNKSTPQQVSGEPVERADGSNCHIAADGFCDTPADYLSYRWDCGIDSFSIQRQKDPTGAEFTSDGTLFMSYAYDECASRFSKEQTDAMRANLLSEKKSYLYNQTPVPPVELGPLVAISPAEGQLVEQYQSVLFQWQPVKNATHYTLEISLFDFFAGGVLQYEVKGTSFLVTHLKKNKTYYWRLRPYNHWNTCGLLTEARSFKTGNGQTTGIEEIEAIGNLEIMPNPVGTGQSLQVNVYSTQPLQLSTTLSAVTGVIVYQTKWNLPTGDFTQVISTEGLMPGLYILQLQSEKGATSRKIVVGR